MYNTNFSDGSYGIEAIIDLHGCNKNKMDRENTLEFVKKVIELTDMEAYGKPNVYTFEDTNELHLNGTSVLQLITTSNVVVHTMPLTNLVLINLFSCKLFDVLEVEEFSKDFFNAKNVKTICLKRGS
jgi:S-adenosylmethionine/arginine decarboxylase-like enzyme